MTNGPSESWSTAELPTNSPPVKGGVTIVWKCVRLNEPDIRRPGRTVMRPSAPLVRDCASERREDDAGIQEIVVVLKIAGILVVKGSIDARPSADSLLQSDFVHVLTFRPDDYVGAIQPGCGLLRGWTAVGFHLEGFDRFCCRRLGKLYLFRANGRRFRPWAVVDCPRSGIDTHRTGVRASPSIDPVAWCLAQMSYTGSLPGPSRRGIRSRRT